jgi:hypothetical protein
MFSRYASDHEVTRFLGWPRHRSLDETRAFLQFSDAEWQSPATFSAMRECSSEGAAQGYPEGTSRVHTLGGMIAPCQRPA